MFSTSLDWTLNSVGKNQVDSPTCVQYESYQHDILVSFEFKVAAFLANWSNYFSLSIFYLWLSNESAAFTWLIENFRSTPNEKEIKGDMGFSCFKITCSIELLLKLINYKALEPWSLYWHACSIVCAGKSTRICGWCGIIIKFVITACNESIDFWVD